MQLRGKRDSLFKQMILFALPLIATALLQTLFNTADLAVVGQFAGSLATAAVGATSSVISLIVSLFMGLSTGVCVLAAQAYGAQDTSACSVRRIRR